MHYKKRREKVEERRTKKKITLHSSLVSHHSSSGFTLLEIMISIAIIATVLITIIQTVNYHAGIAHEHTLTTRMLLMAKEKIAELEIEPKNDKGLFTGTDFSYETTVRYIEDGQQTEDSRIVEIKAIVRGGDKEIELSELITKKTERVR